ncbi:MAG: trehalose-phosphatase [Candidatus Omnitrophota bacterium]
MKIKKINTAVTRKIAGEKTLYLIFDYDGTLTPIVSQPSQAKLSPGVRKMLEDLSGIPGIKLAVLSGRSLSDVEALVGIDSLDYVGNHGLERKIQGRVSLGPHALQFQEFIAGLTQKLKRSLKRIPGVLVEDKTYSLSVHYRNVGANNITKVYAIFQKAWEDFSAKVFFRIRPGKKVWEVRPAYGCSDKGEAIRFLAGSVAKAQRKGLVLVYVGDDTTDEDAFRALKKSDFSIRVGYNSRTAARYWIKSPAEVAVFLKRLIEARRARGLQNVH